MDLPFFAFGLLTLALSQVHRGCDRIAYSVPTVHPAFFVDQIDKDGQKNVTYDNPFSTSFPYVVNSALASSVCAMVVYAPRSSIVEGMEI